MNGHDSDTAPLGDRQAGPRPGLPAGRRSGGVLRRSGSTTSIKVYGGEVESVTMAEPRGLGVRAMREGRVGYAFTADLSDGGLDAVLAAAVANVDVTDADPYAGLPGPAAAATRPSRDCGGRAWAGSRLEDKIELALAVERRGAGLPAGGDGGGERLLRRGEPHRHLLQHRGGGRGRAFVLLRLRAGARRARRRPAVGAGLQRRPRARRTRPGGRRRRGGGEGGGSAGRRVPARPAATPWSSTGRSWRPCCRTWLRASAPTPCRRAGRCSPASWAEPSAAGLVTLVDDGLAPGRHGHQSVRRRGRAPAAHHPARGRACCEAYLHSSYTARKAGEGAASTGNAERGFVPVAGPRWRPPTWCSARARARWTSWSRGWATVCTWRAPPGCTPASTSSAARSRWASPAG